MKKQYIQLGLCGLFIFSSFLIYQTIISDSNNGNTYVNTENYLYPYNLKFNDYISYSQYLSRYYQLNWDYAIENESVGLQVMVMDEKNYGKFVMNDSEYEAIILSNENKDLDSGIFPIPKDDLWFLVFINVNYDEETISADINHNFSYNSFIFLIFPILFEIFVISSFSFIALLRYKKTRKEPYWIFFFMIALFILNFNPIFPLIEYFRYEYLPYPSNPGYGIFIHGEIGIDRYNLLGAGTEEDPYIVENRNIYFSYRNAIEIRYTSDSFIFRNNTIIGRDNTAWIYGVRSPKFIIENNTFIGGKYVSHGEALNLYPYENDEKWIIRNNTFINYEIVFGVNNRFKNNATIENNRFINCEILYFG